MSKKNYSFSLKLSIVEEIKKGEYPTTDANKKHEIETRSTIRKFTVLTPH